MSFFISQPQRNQIACICVFVCVCCARTMLLANLDQTQFFCDYELCVLHTNVRCHQQIRTTRNAVLWYWTAIGWGNQCSSNFIIILCFTFATLVRLISFILFLLLLLVFCLFVVFISTRFRFMAIWNLIQNQEPTTQNALPCTQMYECVRSHSYDKTINEGRRENERREKKRTQKILKKKKQM